MDIHEYQAKEILRDFGVNTPPGGMAYSPEQATYRAHEIGGDKWVVKAQVHTGGRGKETQAHGADEGGRNGQQRTAPQRHGPKTDRDHDEDVIESEERMGEARGQ